MERRKSSKFNGPPTPWKRRAIDLGDEDKNVAAVAAPPQRKVKRIKLRLSEGPPSRPGSSGGPAAPTSDVAAQESGSSSSYEPQPLTALSSNVKVEDGSSTALAVAGPSLMAAAAAAAAPSVLTRIKAQPRNATERAMMQDIETLETLLHFGSRSSSKTITDPKPVHLNRSTQDKRYSLLTLIHSTQAHLPLWAHTAEELSLVTSLCPSPARSKGKAKLSPVMVRSSRSGIARGLLLTRRPMVGQEVAPKIEGEEGRWSFDLVVRSGRVKAAKCDSAMPRAGAGPIQEDPLHDSAASSSMVKQEDVVLNAKPSASIGQLVAHDPASLALYRAWQHRTSLYLFLARPCVCDNSSGGGSSSSCTCASSIEQGGLSLLPCQLPSNIGAVAVGWARVLDAQVVESDQVSATTATTTVRWHMQVAVEPTTWWLPRAPAVDTRSTTSTTPRSPDLFDQKSKSTSAPALPSFSDPFTASNPRSLLRSIACPTCRCAVPRIHWSHYLCPACSTGIDAYVPSLAAGDVDFGTTPVPTEGPRMDNGRAAWDKGCVRRELRSIDGGGGVFKCAEYFWPTAAAVASSTSATHASSSLTHILSSGDCTRRCKTALESLLVPGMPYKRRRIESSAFELGVALSSSSKGPTHSHDPPLLELSDMADISLATRLFEFTEEIEQRAALAVAAAAATGFRGPCVASRAHITVAGCDDVKHRIELPAPHLGGGGGGGAIYLHLGAPATLSVSTIDGVTGSGRKVRTMLNAMVAHGDLLWVPAREATQAAVPSEGEKGEAPTVTVAVEAKALCIGVMLLVE